MCHRPWLEWRTHRTSARRSQAAAGTEQMAPASLAAAGPSKESAWFEVSFPCARTCRACACKAPLPLPEPLGRAPAGSAPPPPAFTPPRERPLPPSARVRAPRPRRAASFLRRRPPGAGGRRVALRAAPPQRAPARGGWVGPPCASSRAAFCGAPFGAAGHIRSQGTRDRAPKLTVPIRFVWLYRISGHQHERPRKILLQSILFTFGISFVGGVPVCSPTALSTNTMAAIAACPVKAASAAKVAAVQPRAMQVRGRVRAAGPGGRPPGTTPPQAARGPAAGRPARRAPRRFASAPFLGARGRGLGGPEGRKRARSGRPARARSPWLWEG